MNRTERFAPFLFLVLAFSLAVGLPRARAAEVPEFPFYPPYDDVLEFLEDDPSPVAVIHELTDSLGDPYLSSDGRRIKAVKISDNPDLDEDEPTFLFIGVIHGLEPLGVQVVLQLIEDLTEGYESGDAEIQDWVNAYEIWIVPVMNTDGYDNQRRPNANDVDLNRNFDFRWDRCKPTGGPPADPVNDCEDSTPPEPDRSRYRGDSAFSETETLAIRDLVLERQPNFGITFHSGRGGTVGELQKVWDDDPDVGDDLVACVAGDPPDDDVLVIMPVDTDRLAVVSQVIRDATEASRSGGRLCDGTSTIVGACGEPNGITTSPIGQSACYQHAATGSFDYQLETSDDLWLDDFLYDAAPEPLSEDEEDRLADAREYVRNYEDGIKGLFSYFLCDTAGGFSFTGPGLTGHVFDHDGNPLAATVKVRDSDDGSHDDDIDNDGDVDDDDRQVDFDDSECDGTMDADDIPFGNTDIEFRQAGSEFGRYLRLLEDGTYTVEFSHNSFPTVTREVEVMVDGGDECLEELDVYLQSPPSADAGEDQTVECTSFDGAQAVLDGSGSTDPDSTPGTNDDIVLFEWFEDFGEAGETLLGTGETLPVTLPLESHSITLRVTDLRGETDTDEVIINVVDTTPPTIDVVLDPGVIWPPNHKLVDTEATVTVEDICDPSPSFVLTSITSDEPDDAPRGGDGNTEDDIQDADLGTADVEFRLRAERSARGSGRTYTATYTAADASGKEASASATVFVSHDQGGK
jgi:hypothetical protein